MDYHIIKISRNKKQYLDLLLLGDEQGTVMAGQIAGLVKD